jgi:hypothetical protein
MKNLTRKLMMFLTLGSLFLLPKISNADARVEKNVVLEQIMHDATQGDTISTYRPYVEFPSEKGKHYYVNMLLMKNKSPKGLKVVIYPEDWQKKIVVDRVITYLMSGEKTRYELEEYAVILNPQTGESWHTTNEEYDNGSEFVFDAGWDLIKGSLDKIGITRSGLNLLVKSMKPEVLLTPVEEPPRREHVLMQGSRMGYHIWLKRVEYDNPGAPDLTSNADAKCYTFIVKEGEKALTGTSTYIRFMRYGCWPSCSADLTPERSSEVPITISFENIKKYLK